MRLQTVSMDLSIDPLQHRIILLEVILMRYAKWISVIMLLVAPTIAAAQLRGSQKLVADVPFTYIVANTVIPLGQTVIQPSDPSGRLITIQNSNARINLFGTGSVGAEAKVASENSLVFHKYGRRYFLAGVRVAGSSETYWFTPSKFEQELLAQNEPVTEQVLLASLR